jgi:hypothetical protein
MFLASVCSCVGIFLFSMLRTHQERWPVPTRVFPALAHAPLPSVAMSHWPGHIAGMDQDHRRQQVGDTSVNPNFS